MKRFGTLRGGLITGLFALGVAAGCGKSVRNGPRVAEAAGSNSSGGGLGGTSGNESTGDSGGMGGGGADGLDMARQLEALERLLSVVCTTPDCVAGLDFEVLRVTRGIKSGRLRINADALDGCLAASSSVGLFYSRPFDPPPECRDLWIPETPVGAACDTDFDCIDGFCERADYSRSRPAYVAGGCGVCVPRRDVGGPCDAHDWIGADRDCVSGLACACPVESDGCAMQCEAFQSAAAGERCGALILCDDGLVCAYAGGKEGTCEATQAPGGPCTHHEVCPDNQCLDMDDSGVGRCGPRQTGEACVWDSECDTDSFCQEGSCTASSEGTPCWEPEATCGDGSVCDGMQCLPVARHGEACQNVVQCPPGSGCVGGVCRRVLGLGAACDASPTAVDFCATGATCAEGMCKPLPHLGEACTTDCVTGACEDGICAPRKAGDPCTGYRPFDDGDPCGTGLECGDSMTCEPRPALGERCAANGACDTGAYCTRWNGAETPDAASVCNAICVLD